MTRREGAAISQRRHPGFDRPARELGRRPNGYPWGRISATDYRAWFPPGMVEPWRLYSIFEIIMPSRRRGAVPERHLSKLGPVCGHRQERKARRPYRTARNHRLIICGRFDAMEGSSANAAVSAPPMIRRPK